MGAKQSKADSAPTKNLCQHQRRRQQQQLQQQSDDIPEDAGEQAPLEPTGDKCPECEAEQHRALVYRLKLIAGLLMPFALQALDVTIVASALPFIAIDFNEVEQLNWIVSAFNLTSAAFIPFWGQIADIFGRHSALQAVLFLMLIGSALCTGAPTNAFPVLLLGRGIQGVACAGIGILTKVIISDKVSLQENAKNWSIFGLTGGLSYAIGPVIGGYLTSANWRWCFGINLPICLLGVVIVFFVLRPELLGPQELPGVDESTSSSVKRLTRRLNTVDSGGQVLFLFGFGLVILAFTWAGSSYGWATAAVLAPLVLGVFICAGWIFYEFLMSPSQVLGRRLPFQRPMIPWALIKNRNVGLLFYINFATGMAMYAVLYFADLYFTLILGYSASKAGVQLLYYTPGIAVGVYGAMVMCNFWPLQTFWPLFIGSVIEAVGIGLLAWALSTGKTATIYGMIAFTGVGTGLRFMPGTLHAVGFFPKSVASVVSFMGIAQPFGGALALTIMTTVYNNLVTTAPKDAFVWAFVAICPFMGLCVVCAACLGSVRISKKTTDAAEDADADADQDDAQAHHVINGSYLLSLFRSEKLKDEASVEQGETREQEKVEA
ncbi:major facilitator superfamily domain-containing protein [Xylariales sp. PMI_506]|nr:major facilitator superfamily domain-containing protein [Xylariales sp. PMI_506]